MDANDGTVKLKTGATYEWKLGNASSDLLNVLTENVKLKDD